MTQKTISEKDTKNFLGRNMPKLPYFEGEKKSEVAILATQIWVIPLADDQESNYFTKLKRKKKKKSHSSHDLNIATQNVVVEIV